MRQLLESVAFMHELRLVHTDLKPENILLTPEADAPPKDGAAAAAQPAAAASR